MQQRVGKGEAERRYGWDKAVAPTTIDDAIWGETRYTYDVKGQVAKAEFGDGFAEKLASDPAKNVAGVALQGPGLDASVSKLFDWRSTSGGVVQLARGPNGETIALTHDVCGRVIERGVYRKGFRPKTWRYGWDAHDRLVRCDNPEGETWFYRYDPFGRRLTKVRKLSERELAWTAQKHAALVPASAREATKIWTWPEPPNGGRFGDTRAPIVGTLFTWDGDVVAEEAHLRLDGSIDSGDSNRWYFEPGGFRPLAKQTPNGTLLGIVNDHLGTPREMVEEGGYLAWAVSYTSWGVVRDKRAPLKLAKDNGRAIYPQTGVQNGNSALASKLEVCPIAFEGQWEDQEIGLAYNRFRYYDPLASQYVSTDPLRLCGGTRPQGYVETQPPGSTP